MNWKDTQLIYHSLARMNMESLVLTSTKGPYTCIGFAQNLRKELDIDYCKEHGIPYFRRETGGGTVYLDKNQLFFQLIIHRDNPLTPKNTENFFRRFLTPVISTLEKLGISAKFVPLNDLIVEDKKISGNGGGEIGDCKVLVGNLLMDFDFKRMASILNVPNEEFRERVYHIMLKNLTTIKSELGFIPPSERIRKYLVREYEKLLGPLTYSKLGEDVLKLMKDLDEKFSTEEWLFQKVPKREGREVKIREGVLIINRKFLTKKWEAELIFQLKEGKIEDLEVVKTSNHNIQTEILKEGLCGMFFEEKQVLNNINELYER
jgi:lipoate-protein ligase A